MEIEGAIFDMDGVLVDNLDHHIRAWQQLGRKLGKDLPARDIRALFGRRNDEILRDLIDPGLSAEQINRLSEHKEALYRQIIARDLRPTPGLLQFMDELQKSGIKRALATSGCLENADLVLDGLHLRDCFNAIVTGVDASRSKPDPEIFLLAARRLSVPASRCIVFEDSIAGITAALRAGCACIALTTTHSEDELRDYPAVRHIADFAGLAVSDLRNWCSGPSFGDS